MDQRIQTLVQVSIKKLTLCGLDFEDYIAHLHEDGICDGLELYLVLAVIECLINVVQESDVWSMSKDGIDFQYLIVMITSYGWGVCCVIDVLEAEV